jgi:hypothetical protein
MKALLFFAGLIVGLVVGAGGLLYLEQQKKDTSEMAIVFPKKFFYDSEQMVAVSGTLTGSSIGYPNNTYSFGCYRDNRECWMTYVNAIGGLQ